MFQLENQNVRVSNLNIRVERHGDERVTAVDVKLVADQPAERLNDISPGLCESLYRKPSRGDQIALIDKKAENAFTVLRHPGLEPVKLKQKFPGYELVLNTLDGTDNDELFFADAEVKNFTLEPHEGGTTAVTFTVSTVVEDDAEIGFLVSLLRAEDAVVRLTPPKREADQPEHKEAA
jgi:hypothetical protein